MCINTCCFYLYHYLACFLNFSERNYVKIANIGPLYLHVCMHACLNVHVSYVLCVAY